MTLDDAREAARRAWAEEREARADRDTLLSAVTKVKRALDDKDRAGAELEQLPKLTPAEADALEADMAWHERMSNAGRVSSLHLRLRYWVEAFEVTRGLRGAGRPEWRPGLFAAAFVLCDWFRDNHGRAPRAALYSKSADADVEDWAARPDGVAYGPSEDVQWLASELALLDSSLEQPDPEGRPLALHQADNFIGLWRDSRGLSRHRENRSSGISGTD